MYICLMARHRQQHRSITDRLITDQTYSKTYYKNGGLIINGNRIFNDNVGYTCQNDYFTDNDTSNPNVAFWAIQDPYKVSSLVYPTRAYNGANSQPRLLLASKMVNTTLFNLPSSVTKTATTAMQIEYTISEV